MSLQPHGNSVSKKCVAPSVNKMKHVVIFNIIKITCCFVTHITSHYKINNIMGKISRNLLKTLICEGGPPHRTRAAWSRCTVLYCTVLYCTVPTSSYSCSMVSVSTSCTTCLASAASLARMPCLLELETKVYMKVCIFMEKPPTTRAFSWAVTILCQYQSPNGV